MRGGGVVMHDEDKSREELLYDVAYLRVLVADLENRHRQTEDLLQVVTEQYKQITAAVSDYIFSVHIIDGAPVETVHGLGCFAITGYSPEEFSSNSYLWINMVHEEDRPGVLKHVANILAGRDVDAFEHRITRKDGVVRWVRNTPVCQYDAGGKLVAYDGLIQDITDHKLAEESLKQGEEKYRLVADYTYDWEYWVGADSSYIYISPSCERVSGYPPEEFMRNPGFMSRILHPDDRASFRRHAKDVMQPGVPPCTIDFRIITKSGHERWISHSCQEVISPSGVWIGRRGSNRDITARKMLQLQIDTSQRLQAVGILAEGIAHDFNNILTALLGNLSLARRSVECERPPVEQIRHAEELCMQASELVRRLLAFSERRSELVIIEQPEGLISSITASMHRMPGIRIEASFSTDLPPITADEQQLRELFRQLILNAEEAMPEGGLISIHADSATLDTASPFGLDSGTYLRIMVRDQGRGIAEEHLPMLFDPYFTTKASSSMRGTGLGLAICFSIAKNHGGTITATSRPGQGSSFTILLRAAPAQSSAVSGPMGTENPA